jgi:nicotinate-nucleotide pyrophosphorylase (carboxylating)
LRSFISEARLRTLVQEAKLEDVGPQGRDVSSEILVPADLQATAVFRSRGSGRLSGAALLPHVIAAYDPAVSCTPALADGAALQRGSVIATIRGPLRSVLAIERVALNFMTRLSGIASLTQRYVHAIAGTRAHIYDTRKTTPGLRELEKYAVVCGGGASHRMGLHDAVLIKDNHIAHLPLEQLQAALTQAVQRAQAITPRPKFVQIEVDTLEQLQRVLMTGCDMVLLDNMSLEQLRQAVSLRNRVAPGVQLEASGGVNLETVGAIAATGVDRVSVGALTHSAPALDIGLDIDA